MYSVIEFEDGMQLVPSKWLLNDSKCAYPRYLAQKRIDVAIEKQEPPAKDWNIFDVIRIFGTASTYERGLQKLELATQFSDIDTEAESSNVVRRRKRKRSFTESDDEDDVQNIKLPYMPTLVSKSSSVLSPEQPSTSSYVPQTPTFTSTSAYRTFEARSQIEESKSQNELVEFLKDFKESTFRKLNRITQKLEVLEKRFSEKEKEEENPTMPDETVFPIKEVKILYEIEKKCEDQTYHMQLVNSLKRVGGNDIYSITVGILKRLLSNEVAEQFSWAGQKKKLPFKDLSIFKLILETVRCHRPAVTEVEISELVSKWLVQAKLRKKRATEKIMQNNTECG